MKHMLSVRSGTFHIKEAALLFSLLVRAAAVVALCQVAVGAQQLIVITRIAVPSEPAVKLHPATDVAPMLCAVLINVVQVQKANFLNAATGTPATIRSDHFQAESLQSLAGALYMFGILVGREPALRDIATSARLPSPFHGSAMLAVSIAILLLIVAVATFTTPSAVKRIVTIAVKLTQRLADLAAGTNSVWYDFVSHTFRASLTSLTNSVVRPGRVFARSHRPFLFPAIITQKAPSWTASEGGYLYG